MRVCWARFDRRLRQKQYARRIEANNAVIRYWLGLDIAGRNRIIEYLASATPQPDCVRREIAPNLTTPKTGRAQGKSVSPDTAPNLIQEHTQFKLVIQGRAASSNPRLPEFGLDLSGSLRLSPACAQSKQGVWEAENCTQIPAEGRVCGVWGLMGGGRVGFVVNALGY